MLVPHHFASFPFPPIPTAAFLDASDDFLLLFGPSLLLSGAHLILAQIVSATASFPLSRPISETTSMSASLLLSLPCAHRPRVSVLVPTFPPSRPSLPPTTTTPSPVSSASSGHSLSLLSAHLILFQGLSLCLLRPLHDARPPRIRSPCLFQTSLRPGSAPPPSSRRQIPRCRTSSFSPSDSTHPPQVALRATPSRNDFCLRLAQGTDLAEFDIALSQWTAALDKLVTYISPLLPYH